LLFSVVLIGKRSLGLRPGIAVRLAALSGLLVSVASFPLQVVPLAGVPNAAAFGLKVGGLVCAINTLGAWLYRRGKRRLQAREPGSENPAHASLPG
jgi:hypothetical protein